MAEVRNNDNSPSPEVLFQKVGAISDPNMKFMLYKTNELPAKLCVVTEGDVAKIYINGTKIYSLKGQGVGYCGLTAPPSGYGIVT